MPAHGGSGMTVSGAAAPGSPAGASISRGSMADGIVYALLAGLGVLQLVLPLTADDFFKADTTYFEYARALLERGRYEIDFHEVMYPPGFPGILAVLCMTVGCSHRILVQSMAVFATLGLIAGYQLLRHEAGRGVAAAACLLLASSPALFAFSTQWVYSDLPYFFTSMTMLLLAARLDVASSARSRLILGLFCAAMLVSSVLIRSSAAALITALAAWLALGCVRWDRQTCRRRLRSFGGILLAGVVIQVLWMGWGATPPVPHRPKLEGHPRSYLSQLKVKSGVQPELGVAAVSEVPLRVVANLPDRAVGLLSVLTRKEYIRSSWFSPLVFGTVLLIVMGLGSSLSGTAGLAAWYFISHEAMYAVWPWPFETRFLLPVVPLACLYLWRGGLTLRQLAGRMPRAVGLAGMAVGALAVGRLGGEMLVSGSMQVKLEVLLWVMIVVASMWMVGTGSFRLPGFVKRRVSRSWLARLMPGTKLRPFQLLAGAAAIGLVFVGIALQREIGLSNLSFDVRKHPAYGQIVAARWAAHNTPDSSVLMARPMGVVHHYSNRRVVWFPPLSNPQSLMQGIRRHAVDYVLVTTGWVYYLPSEEDCFGLLLERYPEAFRLASEGPGYRIFQVLPAEASGGASPVPQPAPVAADGSSHPTASQVQPFTTAADIGTRFGSEMP
jgi:hypothetical protein